MAKVSRSQERTIADQQIYDNNAKEVTPEMVKLVLDALIDSNYNLVDDTLKSLKYDSSQTLEQKFNDVSDVLPLWGATGAFDVVGNTGGTIPISGSQGIVSSASHTRVNNNNAYITINFNKSIASRKITVGVFTNSTNTDGNNDILTPVTRVVSSTQITVALREDSSDVQQVRLEVMAFTYTT